MNKLTALLACIAAAGLSACQPSAVTPSPSAASYVDVVAGPKSDQPEEKVLNFSNWNDYIPAEMLKQFESETGIKVNYKTYGGNEELQKTVVTRSDFDDLVVPGLTYAKHQAEQGLYLPLNKSLLSNYKNIDQAMLQSLSGSDPKNTHFVPWAWGYTTLFLNLTKVRKAIGSLPYPVNEWDLVFKPEYTKALKKCGIAYLDSPSEIIPLAMQYLGLNPYSQKQEDYSRATELLIPVRKDIATFSLKMIDVMSSGSVCAAIAWAGDINTSIDTLRDGGVKDELAGIQPKAGTLMFVDVLAIPVNAKHPRNAHAFINSYLNAKNSSAMPNEIGYANGNSAALEFVKTDTKSNPLIFPPAEFMPRMAPLGGYSDKARWGMMNAYMSFAYDLKQ